MEISIKQLKKFSKDFADIVKPLEEEYGVTIKLGNISYEEDRFSTKMTVTNGRDPDGVAQIASHRWGSSISNYKNINY